MKTASQGTAAAPAAAEDFVSRKLIRPSFAPQDRTSPSAPDHRGEERQRGVRAQKPVSVPADQTYAEAFYYQKQVQARTPLTIVLRNGESVEGTLEWYDKHSLRVARRDGASLLIYKTAIKYMYKTSEGKQEAVGR